MLALLPLSHYTVTMLEMPQLKSMYEKLQVYDVDQRGWAHEHNGVGFNLKHVVLHIVDVLDRKDFSDSKAVESNIAPDSLQYALRLARWGGLATRMIPGSVSEEEATTGPNYKAMEPDYAALLKANGEVGRLAHDFDHADREVKLTPDVSARFYRPAGFLIYSAEHQANSYGFDLEAAFDERLANLRERKHLLL